MAEQYTKFVILLSRVPGFSDSESLIRDHVRFLRELQANGNLVLCGPFTDYAGGMIIINANNIDDEKAIATRDPFVVAGNRTCEVRSWLLSCEENNHLGMG